jgi:hypothetical protein
MKVKPHHPLTELLAQLLHGIETVDAKEQRRMVNRACREAVKWHEEKMKTFLWWIHDMDTFIRAANGSCPECGNWLGFKNHKKDCEMFLLIEEKRNREG